ncbi:serine/threonine-protein kinase [Streptomyces jumonjinensis]|uniref:non-specific serine/threonine protein kinase n=1 Tax=Streptomyces jumonjinensis TaxID=1945 RepID=A0A646KAT1_STRJU|nr:serine/threonine-protein kinase [Streptomyces jumonjinensis]MQS99331.1 serine/threonine protein kinase [Streptomyces jumonjinensis]
MGEVFAGRYELVDPIGRGGVGAVWRAWDQRRRRYVAAKVLQQSDAHTLLRFVREQALRIDHPHVLAPASFAADDDKVLFTMDLVGGGSLAHVIGDYGPLPPRYVCTLLDQLLAGLTAVHAEGVVHRDIKPANVLLEATGTGRPHLRLSDFGISLRKGEPRLTETNYVVGTPGYFAPEQMDGAEPDFPADLFAVGLVALYLLEGQKPDSVALVEYFTSHGTPGAPQGIPEPLWQVLAGLLKPDPESRFRTATGARKALSAAVELLPETGPDDEPVEIFDQLGPLPPGFGPDGPERAPAPVPGDPAPGAVPPGDASQSLPAVPPAPRESPAFEAAQTSSAVAPAPGPAVPIPPAHPPTSGFSVPPPPQQPPTPPAHPARPVAPPPAAGSEPAPAQAPAAVPAHGVAPYPFAPGEPPTPTAVTAPVSYQTPVTGAYTTLSPQTLPVPAAPAAPSAPAVPTAPARAARAARSSRRRRGPAPKVVIPVLILAAICYAVGFWALSQT